MNKDKYYIISNKALALAIAYTTGEKFYTYDDKFNEGKKIYSFINSDKFKEAYQIINDLKKKLDR